MKKKKFTIACIVIVGLFFSLSAFAGGDGQVQYDLGVFALDEGNFAAAEKHFSDAIRLESDNPYYHHYLGTTYLKSGRPENAIGPLETAWKLNQNITGLQFDLAMAYYESGNYSRAAGLFADLVAKDPAFVLARYYQGMSYFKQDSYSQALPPLLRAGEENKSVRDNSYYFAGISHFKSDQPDKAIEKLKYVENRAASEKLRQSARQWQKVIREQQAKSARFNFSLQMGQFYDDNILLDPINQDRPSDEGDRYSSVYFSGKFRAVNDLNRKLGVGYSHYVRQHDDLSEYDMEAGEITFFYQERFTSNLYASLQYRPALYWLEYDRYMRRHKVTPALLWRFNHSVGMRISYDYADSQYYTDTGRSGQGHDVTLDFMSIFFEDKAELTLGAMYGVYDADHPDFDYDLLRPRIEFSYGMAHDLKLVLKGTWDRKEYDNVDSVTHIQREDDRYSAEVKLSIPVFYDWLIAQAEYRYTKNDSNIEYYSYKKNVTGVSLTIKF